MELNRGYDNQEDESHRFRDDYCPLNAAEKRDRWPKPRIDEVFNKINGSAALTTIYLFEVCWQICMAEGNKKKAMFLCRYGTYWFEVIPFGLMKSGAVFQRVMERILVHFENDKCCIDDIVI